MNTCSLQIENMQTIEKCQYQDISHKEIFCYKCEKGWVLRHDGRVCIKLEGNFLEKLKGCRILKYDNFDKCEECLPEYSQIKIDNSECSYETHKPVRSSSNKTDLESEKIKNTDFTNQLYDKKVSSTEKKHTQENQDNELPKKNDKRQIKDKKNYDKAKNNSKPKNNDKKLISVF